MADFDDAISFAFAKTNELAQNQLVALDFDGDDVMDFNDGGDRACSVLTYFILYQVLSNTRAASHRLGNLMV